MARLLRWSFALWLLALALPLHAEGEVEVLRARRALSYLSSNGNGASIYRAETVIDLAVRDLSYAKEVGVRWSADDWATSADARGFWVAKLGGGREHWRVVIDHGTVGRNVRLGGERGEMGPAFTRFAAFHRALGRTWWDNARGLDHAAGLLGPVAQPLPEARRRPRAVTAGGALYLLGGQERESYGFTVPDLLRFEPDTGAWTRLGAFPAIPFGGQAGGPALSPEILTGFEVATQGRGIWLLGGTAIHVGTRSLATLRWDLGAAGWSVGPALPGPIDGRRAVSVGDEVHLVPTARGGDERVWILDAAASAWRASPIAGIELLAGAQYVTASHDGRLYLFGGRGSGSGLQLRDTLVYDGLARRLSRAGAACPVDLGGAEPACVVGGKVLIGNVEPDLARGLAGSLLFDPVAGDFAPLPRGQLLPWETALAAAPPVLIAGPGGVNPRRVEAALLFDGTSRVDTWLPERGIRATGESRTVIRVRKDAGWGHRVTLRGDAAPLAWSRGQDATWRPGQVWTWETTDLLEEALAFKPLVDDASWYPGPDLRVRRGETLTVTWP